MRKLAKNIFAANGAALFAFLFMFAAKDFFVAATGEVKDDEFFFDYLCVAAMIGSAISTIMSFERLGKNPGLFGLVHDIALLIAIVFVATLIGGTLVFPLFGTVLSPVLFIQSLTTGLGPALVIVAFGLAMMTLSRLGHRH